MVDIKANLESMLGSIILIYNIKEELL